MTSPTLSQKSGHSITQGQTSVQASVRAVDLTSESSSVLGNMRPRGALRKLSTSSNVSRSSTGSQQKYVLPDHPRIHNMNSDTSAAQDIDSGLHSMYDSHSQSSVSSQQPSPTPGGAASPILNTNHPASQKYTSRIHGE